MAQVREKRTLEELALIQSSWAEKKVEWENPIFQENESSQSH